MEALSLWFVCVLVFLSGVLLGGNITLLSLWKLKLLSWSSREEQGILQKENERLQAETAKAKDELYTFFRTFLARVTNNE